MTNRQEMTGPKAFKIGVRVEQKRLFKHTLMINQFYRLSFATQYKRLQCKQSDICAISSTFSESSNYQTLFHRNRIFKTEYARKGFFTQKEEVIPNQFNQVPGPYGISYDMKNLYERKSQISIKVFLIDRDSKTTIRKGFACPRRLLSRNQIIGLIKAQVSSLNYSKSQLHNIYNMSSFQSHRNRYQRITFAKRLKLIELVVKKNFSICKAAVMMEIALSTAKIIVKRFRKDGTIFVRKEERKNVKKIEELSQIFESFEPEQVSQENQVLNPQTIPIPYLTYIPPVQSFLAFYSPQMFFDSTFSGLVRLQ